MPAKVLDKWCRGCKRCIGVCPEGALSAQGLAIVVNSAKCIDCEKCLDACVHGAITFVSIASTTDAI